MNNQVTRTSAIGLTHTSILDLGFIVAKILTNEHLTKANLIKESIDVYRKKRRIARIEVQV